MFPKLKMFLMTLCLMSSLLMSAQSKKGRVKDKKPEVVAPKADTAKSKKVTIKEKTEGSKKISGLFILYQDTATGSVQL